MNFVSTLEKNFVEYLKQQMDHSKYEFWNCYTLCFRYEIKHNGRDKLEKHSHKKGSNRLQIQMTHESLYENADLGSAILLKFSWNHTQQNYIGFNPFSFFRRYIYSIWTSQTDIRESKFVTTEGHLLTNS